MKKLITLLITLALIVGAVTLVKKKRAQLEALETATLPPLVIKVVTPHKKRVIQTKSYLATYHTLQKAQLATKYTGTIQKILVQEGQKVHKGDLLAKLDDSALQAAIAGARAKVSAARAALTSTKALLQADSASLQLALDAFQRAKKLYEAEAISTEALQKAEAAYLAAQAKFTATKNALEAKKEELQAAIVALEAKRKDLAYTRITAPFDGKIDHIFFKKGSFAPLGKPILSLLGSQKVFDIPFDKGLSVGMKIAEYPCSIDTILPYTKNALSVARSFCQVPLEEERTVTLTLIQKNLTDLTLPLSALYERKGNYYVFVYKGGKFQPTRVSIVAMDDKRFIPSPTITDPVAIGTHSELGKLLFTQNVKVVRE